MIDVAYEYIKRRMTDIDAMIAVYDCSDMKPPIDLLARRQELDRMKVRLEEYQDVQEADS